MIHLATAPVPLSRRGPAQSPSKMKQRKALEIKKKLLCRRPMGLKDTKSKTLLEVGGK
ncbi:unnamed protein product [Ilex paraguariensis]|uniref:Uncharacterized protein n=1 Tax=Ilex paraguariensis TaxID=185542 RepID=A0ABC8UK12_9AQUA